MAQPASTAIVLRAAAVWGTSVLAVRSLIAGQSFVVGDPPLAAIPKPDGSGVADSPVRAVGASLADITRWNTSCCGIEPSIMVTAAPTKKAMSVKLGSGSCPDQA